MANEKKQRVTGGFSAHAVLAPAAIVLALLHLVIVVLILQINTSSAKLSANMRDSARYTREATDLLAGTSLLSETASNYISMPIVDGVANVTPLRAYAQELRAERQGDQVLARLRNHGLPEESLDQLEAAAACSDFMSKRQLRAIALVRSVHSVPELPELSVIPQVTLTAEEQAMSDAEKKAEAKRLISDESYWLNKRVVSENVNEVVGKWQAEATRQQAAAAGHIATLRTVLWIVTALVVLVLSVVFFTIYSMVMRPLNHFVKLLPTDEPLDDKRGFREVRMVAASYNEVLARRDALDDILHSAAETDALTGLPNRFRFEQYLLETEDNEDPAAVLLFDINYLKKTNDTKGHLAGDRLIRTSAECIAACFGGDGNCFRIGGDEFAAVVRPGTPELLKPMIDRFEAMQAERDISVSWGCAFSERLHREEIRAMFNEADRKMYMHKKETHSRL